MPRIFACPHCERHFDRSAKLKLHLLIHLESKPFVCTFPDCSKAFNRSHHLKQHQLQHSTDPRPFKCPICAKGFTTNTVVKRHVKNLHKNSNEKPEECMKLQEDDAFQLEIEDANLKANHLSQVNEIEESKMKTQSLLKTFDLNHSSSNESASVSQMDKRILILPKVLSSSQEALELENSSRFENFNFIQDDNSIPQRETNLLHHLEPLISSESNSVQPLESSNSSLPNQNLSYSCDKSTNEASVVVKSKFTCPICFFQFSKIQAFLSHQKTHNPQTKARNLACTHANCTRRFLRAYDLERHLKSVHPC